MMKIVFKGKSIKDLEKMTAKDRRFLLKKLSVFEASEEPLIHAEKLNDFRFGEYRFRVGDFRVVFDVEGTKIVVLKIGNRKDIYK